METVTLENRLSIGNWTTAYVHFKDCLLWFKITDKIPYDFRSGTINGFIF